MKYSEGYSYCSRIIYRACPCKIIDIPNLKYFGSDDMYHQITFQVGPLTKKFDLTNINYIPDVLSNYSIGFEIEVIVNDVEIINYIKNLIPHPEPGDMIPVNGNPNKYSHDNLIDMYNDQTRQKLWEVLQKSLFYIEYMVEESVDKEDYYFELINIALLPKPTL